MWRHVENFFGIPKSSDVGRSWESVLGKFQECSPSKLCLMCWCHNELMLQRISFLTKNWRNDENWPSWRNFLTEFDEIGEIRDLWQNFWRNLHFLTKEKWQFWWQNPLEPTYGLTVYWGRYELYVWYGVMWSNLVDLCSLLRHICCRRKVRRRELVGFQLIMSHHLPRHQHQPPTLLPPTLP